MASESDQIAVAGGAGSRELGTRATRRRSEWRAGLRVLRRNKLALAAIIFLAIIHLIALAAPLLAPADPDFLQIGKRFQRPNAEFLLGSDENGRDVLTRLIYGSRVSLLVGSLSVLISVSIGTLAGAVAGYRGGLIDSLIMRFTDGMLTIPTFFLVLIIVTVFGSTLTNIILVIALTSWMVIARIVRGDVLRIVSQDYILAARATGVPPFRLVLRHILTRRGAEYHRLDHAWRGERHPDRVGAVVSRPGGAAADLNLGYDAQRSAELPLPPPGVGGLSGAADLHHGPRL